LTFTIEQQNKFLSLVTTFGCRPAIAGRMDEVPNSTNALTLVAIKTQHSDNLKDTKT